MGILKWPVAGAVLVACIVLIVLHPYGFETGIGIYPAPAGTAWQYQLWSGFLPSLAIVSIFTGVGAHLKMLNCHVHRCWRIGKFPVADGQFKVCRRHSPHPVRLTHEYILAKHEENARCGRPSSSSGSR